MDKKKRLQVSTLVFDSSFLVFLASQKLSELKLSISVCFMGTEVTQFIKPCFIRFLGLTANQILLWILAHSLKNISEGRGVIFE